MKISVGIKDQSGLSLAHKNILISSESEINLFEIEGQKKLYKIKPKTNLTITACEEDKTLSICGKKYFGTLHIKAELPIQLVLVDRSKRLSKRCYSGTIELINRDKTIHLKLICDLEQYVSGVLRSEVPASYELEALKAQAILARTYALRPRIDHQKDGFNVCDSFLCCQAFNGIDVLLNKKQAQAIKETKSIVMCFEGKPALALFSACAGGHTESYSNCFSDLLTNKFPAEEIPYLKGLAEGNLPKGFPDEKVLRAFWQENSPKTLDAWSPNFRWKISFEANDLEAHMHNAIHKLIKDEQFAPFIYEEEGKTEGNGKIIYKKKIPNLTHFGQIQSFNVITRGPSGVAMELFIETKSGNFIICKELVIRSIFANPDLSIKRLRSARIFFDHFYDNLGQLSKITIFGFGSGHGVGLQQVSAQKLAQEGKYCKEILARYYKGTELITLA